MFTAFCLCASAQEELRPLGGNLNYLYDEIELRRPSHAILHKGSSTSLQIPFKDDFNYATTQYYPNVKLWKDSMVYINTGYSYAPPSIGVATFDGLNKNGYPYDPTLFNLTLSKRADTLTSLPINLFLESASSKTLQPSDSIGLVFYYQPRGYGDPPESNDSLILDFYRPGQGYWKSRVWFKTGSSSQIIDTAFKRVFIRIDSAVYLQDGFAFRFRNKATTAGNFDHWHLDYVYLNRNLYVSNTAFFDDITFGTVPTPFLREYSAMPWQQYTQVEMAEKLNVRIRNNNAASGVLNASYEFRVFDPQNSQLYRYEGGPDNLHAFTTAGYSTLQVHRRPEVSNNFTFPLLSDSSDFLIKHYLYRSGSSTGQTDFLPMNDTVLQFQRFRNYYAFDDGGAEAGYYVNGKGGRIAVRIKLNQPDTLRAVRIYFDPSGNVPATDNYEFRINVWAVGSNGAPASLILQDSAVKAKIYKTGFKGSPEYLLTKPYFLSAGSYFVGITQKVASGIVIGFDRNYDFRYNLYFDSGGGWEQSTIAGSLMMRPVFGSFVPPPVGIDEIGLGDNFVVYPNPASANFMIRQDEPQQMHYMLYNSLGVLAAEGTSPDAHINVSTSHCAPGIYILILQPEGKPAQQRKLIISGR
jgi:hypothetical protein